MLIADRYKRKNKMKKVLKIAALILLALLVIWTFVFLWNKSKPKVKNYQIEQAQQATIEKKTVATGKVQPRNEILIKPQMSGIIAELYKEAGDKVSFTLAPADGYGEIVPEAIVDLPKNIFMIDGKLAEEMLFVGNQIPMSDSQGNRMLGVVKEVAEETVKMDFNHPMAGKTLNFDVEVVEVRDVTPEDLAAQGGCNCGCHGDCEGGCDGGCEGGCN